MNSHGVDGVGLDGFSWQTMVLVIFATQPISESCDRSSAFKSKKTAVDRASRVVRTLDSVRKAMWRVHLLQRASPVHRSVLRQ